jgi:hypothetical protein
MGHESLDKLNVDIYLEFKCSWQASGYEIYISKDPKMEII